MTNEQDTREKLEEDIERIVKEHNLYWLRTFIIEWLDRQAAITERECIDKRIADQIGSMWMRDDIRKLKAERDDYKASMETLEANANLWREQADKLKAENERLSDRVNGLLLELLVIAEKLGAENADNAKS